MRIENLSFIAGPCVIESEQLTLRIAEFLAETSEVLNARLTYKASFDKANRSRFGSYRGPGLDEGLAILERVKDSTGLAVTTDVHEPKQCEAVAQVCEIIQIPAFLSRQTDLIRTAAYWAGIYGRTLNIKKPQFLSPHMMKYVIEKTGMNSERIILTERGSSFGYGIVNDMRAIPMMKSYGVAVCFDATHSTEGNREMTLPLASAAVACGCDIIFLETHPDPDTAKCDGASMVHLQDVPQLFERFLKIREAVHAD